MTVRLLSLATASVLLLLAAACGSTTSTTTPTFVMKGGVKAARFADLARGILPIDGLRLLGGSPTQLSVKMYALYFTASNTCAAPFVEIGSFGATGQTFDMVSSPTVVSASPAAGTYSCFIIHMSDVMTFKPDATAQTTHGTKCTQGTSYTFDIYRDGETTWKTKDGNSLTGTGTKTSPAETSTVLSGATVNGVSIFATTATSGAALSVGASNNQMIPLTAAVTIPATGTTTLNLLVDFNNKVSTDSDPTCWMEPGPMTITL